MTDVQSGQPQPSAPAVANPAPSKGMKELLLKKTKAVVHEVKFRHMFTSQEQKQSQELDLLRSKLVNPKRDRKENFLVYRICQKMEFFNRLTEVMNNSNIDILLKFLDGASYEKHPPETVLMKEDDFGDKAYVVLRGKVAVLRKQAQQAAISSGSTAVNFSEASPITKKLAALQIMDPKQIAIEVAESQNPNYSDLPRQLILFLRRFGMIVGFFQREQMFGDVALTTASKRTATAVTLEETELMVFTRENFQHIKRFYTEEFLEREQLLKHIMPKMENIRDPKKETQLVQSFQPATFYRVGFSVQQGSYLGQRRQKRNEYLPGARGNPQDIEDHYLDDARPQRHLYEADPTERNRRGQLCRRGDIHRRGILQKHRPGVQQQL